MLIHTFPMTSKTFKHVSHDQMSFKNNLIYLLVDKQLLHCMVAYIYYWTICMYRMFTYMSI